MPAPGAEGLSPITERRRRNCCWLFTLGHLTATYLLCEPAREEWYQVFGINLQKAFEMWLHKVHLILLFCQLRQVLGVQSVSLQIDILRLHLGTVTLSAS